MEGGGEEVLKLSKNETNTLSSEALYSPLGAAATATCWMGTERWIEDKRANACFNLGQDSSIVEFKDSFLWPEPNLPPLHAFCSTLPRSQKKRVAACWRAWPY